jgi:hypothetical protein
VPDDRVALHLKFLRAHVGYDIVFTMSVFQTTHPGSPGIVMHTDGHPFGSSIFDFEGSGRLDADEHAMSARAAPVTRPGSRHPLFRTGIQGTDGACLARHTLLPVEHLTGHPSDVTRRGTRGG